MPFQLVCIAGEAVPPQVVIDERLDLGRDPHCDVRLLGDAASRYHAAVEPTAEGVLLSDNRSSNGTWVGERRIARERLCDGDLFTIGAATFAVVDLARQAGATRVLTDGGGTLTVTGTRATRAWHAGDEPADLPRLHQALQLLATCPPGKRPRLLAGIAARLSASARAAVVWRGTISDANMPHGLARRLAVGGEAHLLTLGRDLIGQTVARAAIGSAASAPLGKHGHLVVARDVAAEALGERELELLARLAAEAAATLGEGDEAAITAAEEELIGSSTTMHQLRNRIRRIAATEATVLITGESGTGKELVARALHRLSGRNRAPLVAVNCAAIAANLVESELFGHVKGAFTGAERDRPGRFQAADGGTLFLDEIGELPLELQAKLLRALQQGEVERVGAVQPETVDVRVIAATNRDLAAEVTAGRFREDLFYRLDVIRIHTPALREHRQDIPELARHLLDRAGHEVGVAAPAITDAALTRLASGAFPGNVRQLANRLTRALVMADGPIDIDHLELADPAPDTGYDHPDRFPTLAEMEAAHIRAALDRCQGNKSAAARLLGISRPTIHKKIVDYGIGNG